MQGECAFNMFHGKNREVKLQLAEMKITNQRERKRFIKFCRYPLHLNLEFVLRMRSPLMKLFLTQNEWQDEKYWYIEMFEKA